MDAASQNKTERINLRVKSSAKNIITLAAGFEGKTVSHFILTSALKCAEKTVQAHQMMIIRGQACHYWRYPNEKTKARHPHRIMPIMQA